jgi:hypothetical protein
MTELATEERPHHLATRLIEAFERWTATPAGDHASRMTIDVVDSADVRVRPAGTVVKLTRRQISRLAAALAGAHDGYATDSGEGLAFWLGRDWAPRPDEQAAATLLITDWRITDDHLDRREKPYPLRVPIGADRIVDLTRFVASSAELLLFERRALLPQARWAEGQRLRIGTAAIRRKQPAEPPREVAPGVLLFESSVAALDTQFGPFPVPRRAFPGTGQTCVVSEIHVHLASQQGAAPTFSYLVHVDNADPERGEWTLWLDEDELEPIE